MPDSDLPAIAAIAIGRNEGARLVACLASLAGKAAMTIYVDSGSADGSVGAARAQGAHVVALDMTRPFTAARARNEGFAALIELAGEGAPDLVQFIDGDCALAPGWLEAATAFLRTRPDVALVCGRRRERAPGASIYNRLCDIEWATPVGEAASSGGDFLIRRSAFEAVGGFNADLIAGEEPDLCYRLRERGFRLWRLDAEMTLHDAAMTRVGQWWRRTLRSGYAYANGFALHGKGRERFRRREVMRASVMGGAVPLAALSGALLLHPAFLLFFGVYGVQAARTFAKRADLREGRVAYALACALGRIPEFFGMVKFWRAQRAGRQAALIEYK